MSTPLDRAIDVLSKVHFAEAQDVLNELRSLKLQSLNRSNILQLKVSVLKAAQGCASKAYQAIEGLDEADDLLALVAFINKELLDAAKPE